MRPVAAAVLACAIATPALAATPAVDWATAQHITVVMLDYRFQPDHLMFRPGSPYVLHMVNRGKDVHEFTAPEFFAAAFVRNRRAALDDARQVTLQPGEAIDVALVPLRAGRYDLTCADHDWDGMTGEIEVK